MIGVIDLGSNLTKLVVAETAPVMRVVHRSIYNTKTLKNAPKGYFDALAISQIDSDVSQVIAICREHQCRTILGIATSAFRTRSNGREVIAKLNEKYGMHIQIISGETEAQLIFKGATHFQSIPNEQMVMVMDIGGGSTEFILGTSQSIYWKKSFDFGSTALTAGWQVNNPLSKEDLTKMRQRLSHILPELWEAIAHHRPQRLIGTTGAFESLAQIIEGQRLPPTPVVDGYAFDYSRVDACLHQLIHSTQQDRLSIPGVHPMRQDTIPIAAYILRYILKHVQCPTFTLSLADVKEGLILTHLEQHS